MTPSIIVVCHRVFNQSVIIKYMKEKLNRAIETTTLLSCFGIMFWVLCDSFQLFDILWPKEQVSQLHRINER